MKLGQFKSITVHSAVEYGSGAASNDVDKNFVSKTERREVTVLEKREMEMPTTRTICQQCGNNVAYWWLRQLGAADERS